MAADMFSVDYQSTHYNSPLIGNGEVVTMIGPTGFHGGCCPQDEAANRTLFWAGRRLRDAHGANIHIPRVPAEELIGATIPLVRFGRLDRNLSIDGEAAADDRWEQRMDFPFGAVISKLDHGSIIEETRSLVCLTQNVLVFRTRLHNVVEVSVKAQFCLAFTFGDAFGWRAPDTRLHIRKPHPADLPFGNVEGRRRLEGDISNRPPHLEESLQVLYEVQDHLGEVHLGRYPEGRIEEVQFGGRLHFDFEIAPGASEECWFWVVLSDRLKYTHFPDFGRVQDLVSEHERAWTSFWSSSQLQFGEPELEAVRKSCLYTLRCNASPWSLPPGYLSTHWEGRTFHDEVFPFMALLSGGYMDLAEGILGYRLLTLPHAIQRAAGHGAYFGWEVTEDGRESAPYGHWTDERFIHGQFSEMAWQFFLITQDLRGLAKTYPLIRECARWLIHDVLERDEAGRLGTRLITDMNEEIYPVENSIYVASATIRTLENAAHAAELLNEDREARGQWLRLAAELRKNLPVDESASRYQYSSKADIPLGFEHVPMIFPFPFDVHGNLARATMTRIFEFLEMPMEEKKRSSPAAEFWLPDYWIWALGHLATQFFYQFRGDEGYQLLKKVPALTASFMAPNENFREGMGAYLPWLTTPAGFYIHALHSMFIQTDDRGALLCPALPQAIREFTFSGLQGSYGVRVDAQMIRGKLQKLILHSNRAMKWEFRLPATLAEGTDFRHVLHYSEADRFGFSQIEVELEQGITQVL